MPQAERRASARNEALDETRARRAREREARRALIRRRRAVALASIAGAVALLIFVVNGIGGDPSPTASGGGGAEAEEPPPPPAAPAQPQLARAAAYARARQGNASFAVVDTDGRLRGIDARRQYVSASVVKAMILVAYLDLVQERGSPLTDSERSQLSEMIRRSDNASATQLAGEVGSDRLRALARRAGMRGTEPQAQPWGLTETTAADQARLFARIDELTPSRDRGFARRLLTTITPEHRWGIPAGAWPGSTVLFKGGWLPDDTGAWRVHQIAKVERGERKLSVAVMTDDNPSQAYGEETVRGVAARLLR